MKKYNEYINEGLLSAMKPKSQEDIDKAMEHTNIFNKIKYVDKYNLDKSYIQKDELENAFNKCIKEENTTGMMDLLLYDKSLSSTLPPSITNNKKISSKLSILENMIHIRDIVKNITSGFNFELSHYDNTYRLEFNVGIYYYVIDTVSDGETCYIAETVAIVSDNGHDIVEYDTPDSNTYELKMVDIKTDFKPLILKAIKIASDKDRVIADRLVKSLSAVDEFINKIN